MAVAGIRPGTEGLNLTRELWNAMFQAQPNEEPAISGDFMTPDSVEQRMGELLHIRIVPTVAAQSLASTDQANAANLTFHTTTALEVTATPVGRYFAINFPISLDAKLIDSDLMSMRATYRKQGIAGLDEAIDAYAALTLAPLASDVKGPANFDKASLLDLYWSVRRRAKDHVKDGTQVHLKYHPTQGPFITTIDSVMNADARGDGENPNVKGTIIKALGFTLTETGNILYTGGQYYNMAFCKQAYVLAYNRKPFIKQVEDDGLSASMFGYTEFGVQEVFDSDCSVHLSA
jgi:hypothetical protein